MTGIYPSPDSEEFRLDIKKLAEIRDNLIELSSSDVPLKELIALKDKGDSLVINLTAYADSVLSTDTENPEYLKASVAAEEAAVSYQRAEDAFIRAAAGRRDEFSDPSLADYSKYLSDILIEESHLMSAEEEALAAELSRSGSSAWERLMQNVTATVSRGGRTLTELRLLASDHDRAVRQMAYQEEIALLEEHKTALAASLNGVKGTVLLLERKRGWNDPLDRSLFASAIDGKILDGLISAIVDSLPVFRKYFEIKARLLGLDKLDFFDLFAPVGDASEIYSFGEARKIVVSSYSSFSSEMGEFAESAFDSGWIDAEPRKGKAGGAYDVFFPIAKESRVFCNFDGSYDSVATIAHELGHAYHDSVVRDLPPSLSSYPMTLAETASIFGEMLVFDNVLSSAGKDEALAVVEAFVQSAAQVIVDIYSRFLFERSVFEERKSGEISADRLSELMLSAQEKSYGDALGIKHKYMWAVKSHYYSADFSYYNYPYAFGELFALSLYSRKDEKGFSDTYKHVLRCTGMMQASDAAMTAGEDITDAGFWKKGIDVIADYIERLGRWS